jgi:hypothetical protein
MNILTPQEIKDIVDKYILDEKQRIYVYNHMIEIMFSNHCPISEMELREYMKVLNITSFLNR